MWKGHWSPGARVDWLHACQRAQGALGSRVVEMFCILILVVTQVYAPVKTQNGCISLCVNCSLKNWFKRLKEKKILWLRKLILREKSSRSQVETEGYLGPEAMNLIKADLVAVINLEPFASAWTNQIIWDQNKRNLLYLVWNLKS